MPRQGEKASRKKEQTTKNVVLFKIEFCSHYKYKKALFFYTSVYDRVVGGCGCDTVLQQQNTITRREQLSIHVRNTGAAE